MATHSFRFRAASGRLSLCRAAMVVIAIVCLVQPASSFVSLNSAMMPSTTATSLTHPSLTTTTMKAPADRSSEPSSPRSTTPFKPWALAATSAQSSTVESPSLEKSPTVVVGKEDRGPTSSTARKAVGSVSEAKDELLELISRPPVDEEQSKEEEKRVRYLLEVLEGVYIPIQTAGFFNLAVQGKWHLAYTNALMPAIGLRLKIYEQFQQVDPGDGLVGELKNVLVWHLKDEDLDGRLEIACKYKLDPKGRMNVSLGGHRVLPDGKMPSDAQGLVKLLQRAMPFEMFDPNDHAFETSFLDDSMRIVRIRGPKLEGRLNIFVREKPSLPLQPGPEQDAEVAERGGE